VAPAGAYVSLHLAPDNNANTPLFSFFRGWMPFLPTHQQHQSSYMMLQVTKSIMLPQTS